MTLQRYEMQCHGYSGRDIGRADDGEYVLVDDLIELLLREMMTAKGRGKAALGRILRELNEPRWNLAYEHRRIKNRMVDSQLNQQKDDE